MEESGMGNHIWTRRDWVGAVGAGLASTAFTACPGAETRNLPGALRLCASQPARSIP